VGQENGRIERWQDQLAELAIFGANVQPGQLVAVTSYIGKEHLTRKSRTRRTSAARSTSFPVLRDGRWQI
jgi:hypothetical protein